MYFDLEDRTFETPTIESAMSWREQVLLSVFAHVAVALLVVVVPRLSFVQEAAERRAERLGERAEAAQLQALMLQQQRQDESRPFIFIQPRIEVEPQEPPRQDAPLSDRDRVAASPLSTPDPENRFPVADGNSLELIVAAEEPADGLDPVEAEGRDDGTDNAETFDDARVADSSAELDETTETPSDVVDDPGSRPELEDTGVSAIVDSSLTEPGTGPGDPDSADVRRLDLTPDGLLGKAVENLRQRVQRETFRNYSGDTGRFGPDIQFDSKGVEFGPWLRRFVAQIRRNWFVPYAIWSMHGHVVLTFNVHRDGTLTDLTVLQPSHVESFTNSAFNALRSSDPTQPLPLAYPDDQAFFTVTFYFNEAPPAL